ncbi:MAG: hypothetical protein J4N77_05755 [Chloroflexi bacterium]|nr:hypothetical protein [Chloroflexota bacterium]
MTKRTRLFPALREKQLSGKCGNHVVAFIQAAMNHPPKYPSNPGHSRSDDGDGTIRSPARN